MCQKVYFLKRNAGGKSRGWRHKYPDRIKKIEDFGSGRDRGCLLYQMDKGDAVTAAALEEASPVAWQHINFYGRYEFTKSVQAIDIDSIVQELVRNSSSICSTE